MPSTSITSSELATARTRLGLTTDQFAAELGLPPHAYAACEAGTARLPKFQAQMVAFRIAALDRHEALASSGLPTCPWIEDWAREEPPIDAKAERQLAHVQRGETHAKACATCQAREQFVRERFPEMPKPPVAGWMRIVGGAVSWIEARPEWMRPAFYGAAILAAMTSLRAVFVLLGAVRQPRLALMALGAVALAAVAGAGGGLVYALVGRPARRVPVVGPYLAGTIAVAGYLGCVLSLMALTGADDTGVDDLWVFAFAAVLFGVFVGHKWLRPANASGDVDTP
jgi:hypothetical protein